MSDGPPEEVILRKFVYGLADADGDVDVLTAVEQAIDRLDELEAENRRLRQRVEEAERKSSNALGVAKAHDDGVRADGSPSKVEQARLKARNELVRKTLLGSTGTEGAQVTVAEVQDMCRPELDVKYQTVKDAFAHLTSKWDTFTLGETADGNRSLQCAEDALRHDLVGAVEEDLGRDDLTKRLISSGGGGGGR